MDNIADEEFINLQDAFLNISDIFPSKIALIFYKDEQTSELVTYQELRKECLIIRDLLLNKLPIKYATSNSVYALYADCNLSVIACMLGILCNGAFIYMSSELTEIELVNMIMNIHVQVFLIHEMYIHRIPAIYQPVILEEFKVFSEKFVLIYINITNQQSKNEEKYFFQNALAYVICTSGSTGFPKVVYVPHKCIVPNIKDFKNIFNISSNDTILNVSPLSFDPSIVDIFTSISYGAKLIMLAPNILKKSSSLECIIKMNRISFIQLTPTLFGTLSSTFLKELIKLKYRTLRIIALGGEIFPFQSKWKEWFDFECNIKVYNLYGVTELSCWASYHEVDMRKYLLHSSLQNISSIPLGEPLTGVELYLTDDYGNKITNGEGHITITGERNVCQIMAKNIPQPIGQKAIITGDIGYSDGINMYFKGRFDSIVKRNACKIGLTEIEMISKLFPGVSESCAIFYENKIVLYVSELQTRLITINSLKKHLGDYLSSWKLPNYIFILQNLPLNRNRKIDRQKLSTKFKRSILKTSKIDIGSTSIIDILSTLWEEELHYKPNENDNFIILGGNSLQAVSLSEKIQHYLCQENSLILQTILNCSFKDVCKVLYKCPKFIPNSTSTKEVQHMSSYKTNSNVNYNLRSMSKKTFNYACRGGHYLSGKKTFAFWSDINVLKIHWTTSLNKCIDSSPLIVDFKCQTKIFIGAHSCIFLCIDNFGNVIWKALLPDRIEASATVSIDGDAIYIGCYDGHLYCLDVNNGEQLWKLKTEGSIKSSCVVDTKTNSIIFGSYDRYLYCCDKTGILKWKKQLSNGYITSTSVIVDNSVFSGTLDGYIVCLNIQNGSCKWKKFIGYPIFSSLAICSVGIIFGCTDHYVYCVKFDSNILWQYRTEGPIFSSPFVLGDKWNLIAIGSHDHILYLFDDKGNKIASAKLTSPIFSTPFIAVSENDDNVIVFVAETNGFIHIFELFWKINIWIFEGLRTKYKLDGEIFSSPVIYNNRLFIGCRNNLLYCLSG